MGMGNIGQTKRNKEQNTERITPVIYYVAPANLQQQSLILLCVNNTW